MHRSQSMSLNQKQTSPYNTFKTLLKSSFFMKNVVSYEALSKQPIADAEAKLRVINEASGLSINGLESYIKTINRKFEQQLSDKLKECKEIFMKPDKPLEQVMGSVIGKVAEMHHEMTADVAWMISAIEVEVIKPLQDYQKEVVGVKDVRKELKDAYDKIEQIRQNLDKSKKECDYAQKALSSPKMMNMDPNKKQASKNELLKLEEKVSKIEKELDESTTTANEKYDKYTESLYKRIAEEYDMTKFYLKYLKIQREFHVSALEKLDKLVPEVEDLLKNYAKKPVFGCSLEECARLNRQISTSGGSSQLQVSPVIKKLIDGMAKQGAFSEEGIFRITGSRMKMNCLLYAINAGYLDSLDINDFDVHCLAGVLKQYIRELPDSLLCNSFYSDWLNAINTSPMQNKLDAFKSVLSKLPQTNHDNLKYLIKFLSKIVENSEKTKMTTSNLGICFSVSLLNNTVMSASMNSSLGSLNNNSNLPDPTKTIDMSTAAQIFDFILTNHKELFPGDINFALSNLASKPSFYSSTTSIYNTLPKSASNSLVSSVLNESASAAPAIIQRQPRNNTSNSSSTENFASGNAESPKFNRYSVMYGDSENQYSAYPKALNTVGSLNSGSPSSSNTVLGSITHTNRHVKKGSFDSRQIEQESISPVGSQLRNIQSPLNTSDIGSTSPKQRAKKQAPAPPPVTSSNTNAASSAPSIPSNPPTVLQTDNSNTLYPKLSPNQSIISTSISNSVRGANELSQQLTPASISLSKLSTSSDDSFNSISSATSVSSTSTAIFEKPNQPPPIVPLRPPPIGFSFSPLPNENETEISNNHETTITTTNPNSNNNNNNLLLSTSTISIQSTSSSSSSQEMLNSPSSTMSKGPKPAVPRRPGPMITAQLNKFNKPKSTEDLAHSNLDDTGNTQAPRASSEITSL